MEQDIYLNWEKEKLVKEIKKLEEKFEGGYGLVWEDKTETCAEECKTNHHFIIEDKSRAVGLNESEPVNILIEGENYHALSILITTHSGKVDVIYIDPPYNNGKKDWKYNNNYVDDKDVYQHSKWLSLMRKRLILAKDLLTEGGVLICTIDYNESWRLAGLLEEVFPSKKIQRVTIVHNPKGVQGDGFSNCHEDAYFVYPKKRDSNKQKRYIGKVKRSKPSLRDFRDSGGESLRTDAKNCFYPFFIDKDLNLIGTGDTCAPDFHPKSQTVYRDDGVAEIYPIDRNGVERKWRYAADTVCKVLGDIRVKKIKSKIQIQFYKDTDFYKTVWIDSKYSATEHGTKLLKTIIESKFNYPKSLYAVEDCIRAVVHDKDNSIILDFFAGSGTTGHAVLNLNKEDGGNRQFILCTNNENNICEDVTYPRIKNIIEGNAFSSLSEEKSDVDNNIDYMDFEEEMEGAETIPLSGEKFKCRLKYFKISSIEAEKITEDVKINFASKSVDMLCLKENCFDEVSSKGQCKIFKNENDKYLGIICDDDFESIKFLVEEIKRIGKKFVVYLFSYDELVNDEGFEEVIDLVDLYSYPSFMLNTYKRIHR